MKSRPVVRMDKACGRYLQPLVARKNGEMFELDGYAAVGMDGPGVYTLLTDRNTQPAPFGSEMMLLPDRFPVLYNIDRACLETVGDNPHHPGETIYPVAVFNSPGYVNVLSAAYEERSAAVHLPLFAYGAVGWFGGQFRTPVIHIDREPRQDLRLMPEAGILSGIREMRGRMPENRLRAHLETCAMTYGCPAAKNFFLGRYEAPLPTSRVCNADCLGCISLQKKEAMSCCQERIAFTPTAEEISEIALVHFQRVRHPVVSFGQGCEGDPLLAAHAIEPAIQAIRKQTARGTINMNTNASLPEVLSVLFDAGLDSIRVSMNSFREMLYTAYFRPKTYVFEDVIRSVELALSRGKHVAINYLNCPGITDTPEEHAALTSFLKTYPVHQIQWRNLNFDPIRYWRAMHPKGVEQKPLGMDSIIACIRKAFPEIRHGYFNPPREAWGISRARH